MNDFATLGALALLAISGQAANAAAPASAPASASGQRLMLRCQTCHAVKAGAPAKVGPNLNKMFGRKAGLVPGYRYSSAMTKSGVVWSDATMDKWLAKPTSLIPGTTMAFVGLPKAEERAALIAYLKQATK